MKLNAICKRHFGYKPKPAQREVIEASLHGHNVMGILPTGFGKSLTYGLSCLLRKKMTVVFSPLIALMQDQVQAFTRAGIPCARISSDMSESDMRTTMRLFRRNMIKLLFVAPERLKNTEFLETAQDIGLGCICVDECHPEGQLIDTPNGPVPVESVKEGAVIWGVDFPSETRVQRTVVRVSHLRTPVANVLDIALQSGRVISITQGHPVLLSGVGYVPACTLQPGDLIAEFDDGTHLPDVQEDVYGVSPKPEVLRAEVLRGPHPRGEGCKVEQAVSNVREEVCAIEGVNLPYGTVQPLLFACVLRRLPKGDANLPRVLAALRGSQVLNPEDMLSAVWREVAGRIFVGTDDAKKSNEIAKRAAEGLGNYEEAWRPFCNQGGYARGQWARTDGASEGRAGMVPGDDSGTPRGGGVHEGREAAGSLRGLGTTGEEVDNRGGRGVSQKASSAGVGREKGSHLKEVRVASVTLKERVHNALSVEGAESHTSVFSLTVEGGSYLTNGVVVHNCHCLSVNGKDFRPAYMGIKRFAKLFPGVPIMALTATADPDMERDIVRGLGMGEYKRVIGSPRRDNLKYSVRNEFPLFHLPQLIRNAGEGSKVIYCSSRKSTEAVASFLRDQGIRAGHYHAGMEKADRSEAMQAFMDGRIDTITATNAFGMGVDKGNVRLVYHHHLPGSIYDYVQESGRGGRDGKDCQCVLNISKEGEKLRNFFIRMANPKQEIYENLWEYIIRQIGVGKILKTAEVNLYRAAHLPDAIGGQAMSAIRFMEYSGMIETTPGIKSYFLNIRNGGAARRFAEMYPRNVRIRGARMMVSVDPTSDSDPVDEMVAAGAVWGSPPRMEVMIKRVSRRMNIDSRMIDEKRAHDEAKLFGLYRFAAAKDKQSFIEQVFLRKSKEE